MLFSYDFPHFKTQELLFNLIVKGYDIKYVIGMPWVNLGHKPHVLRMEPRFSGLIHPKTICERFKIPYLVMEHNSQESISYVKENPVDYGIVGGARILSEDVINSFKKGIVNIHPGLLPEIRGLETIKWSIYLDKPLGNTVHLINPKIDAGKMIVREEIEVYTDDTLPELYIRLVQAQPSILIKALDMLKRDDCELVDLNEVSKDYHSNMPVEYEKKVADLLPVWLKKYSVK